MAKGFIAIDPNKQVRQLTEEGLTALKRLHQVQRITGWQYGKAENLQDLLSKVVTVNDASSVLSENEKLKAKIAELEATMSANIAQNNSEVTVQEVEETKKAGRPKKSVNTEI